MRTRVDPDYLSASGPCIPSPIYHPYTLPSAKERREERDGEHKAQFVPGDRFRASVTPGPPRAMTQGVHLARIEGGSQE